MNAMLCWSADAQHLTIYFNRYFYENTLLDVTLKITVAWGWFMFTINTLLTGGIVTKILYQARTMRRTDVSSFVGPTYGMVLHAVIESAMVTWIGLLVYEISSLAPTGHITTELDVGFVMLDITQSFLASLNASSRPALDLRRRTCTPRFRVSAVLPTMADRDYVKDNGEAMQLVEISHKISLRNVTGIQRFDHRWLTIGDRHLGTNPGLHDDSSYPKQVEDAALGIASQLFVISLPDRMERRKSMDILQDTLGLRWTYVDAVQSHETLVEKVMSCVRATRLPLTTLDTNSLDDKNAGIFAEEEVIKGEFQWPRDSDIETLANSRHSLGIAGSDRWHWGCINPYWRFEDQPLESLDGSPSTPPLDLMTTVPSHPGLHYDLYSAVHPPLTCAARNSITGVPYAPSVPAYMLLTPAKIACWASHVKVIRRIADGGSIMNTGPATESMLGIGGYEDVTVVLEDDIDMERDIRDRLRSVWGALPEQWDIVFLGGLVCHCWSNESYHPALPMDLPLSSSTFESVSVTTLHPSFGPKCTHAYALTRTGARRLLLHLRHPPFAYSRALDQAFAWLILSGRLKAFSVVPSVVVQRKVFQSDIDKGRNGLGSTWRDQLQNGVLGH
ncbi:hypothetical protein A0H81_00264 [Grifola frondosa]|uniref:Glycosyltransferase family 25 protein n=1 Tax=Grifola frondosa TaxID=5627 RepID=A0A1C7MRY9_GRIFR|nr:hypothetical protein A0H81_00264 [Grifola frondosa]